MSFPGWKVSNMLPGKNGEKLLIPTERMIVRPKWKQNSVADVFGGESKV